MVFQVSIPSEYVFVGDAVDLRETYPSNMLHQWKTIQRVIQMLILTSSNGIFIISNNATAKYTQLDLDIHIIIDLSF